MKRQDKEAKARYLQKLELLKAGTNVNPFETETEQKERIAMAKKDIKYMVEYYFPHYATSECADFHIDFANKVKRNQTIKAFAQWGRGLAKSVWCDVLIPFWLWINEDVNYIVLVGKNYDKAKDLLSDLQSEFEANQRIINDFGEQELLGSWEEGNFRTKSGFIGKALGMGQSVRGLRVKSQRPDMVILDDIEDKFTVKNPKRQHEYAEWVERALLPTMDGTPRRLLYANNRFAPVMIQTILQTKHPKWFVHEINAYDETTFKPAWHQKYDNKYYADWEEEIGSLAARAEFNNKPHVEGKIFKSEDIQWCKLPRLDSFKSLVGHWDIAYAGTPTADYNALRVWGVKEKNFYYVDGFVKQSKMSVALDWAADFQKSLPQTVRVTWRFEAQFWNDEVERTIKEAEERHKVMFNFIKVDTPRGKKYDRIVTLQSYYQNGRIYHNEKKKAHNMTQIGNSQLLGIEPGYKTHDDAPDADQQAIEYLSNFITISNSSKPITGRVTSKNRY